MDEWPVGNGRNGKKGFYQHKTLEDRLATAKIFRDDFKYEIPLYVDSMDNQFDRAFASWPVRWYILIDNKVHWKAMPSTVQYTYPFEELQEELEKVLGVKAEESKMNEDDEDCDECSSCSRPPSSTASSTSSSSSSISPATETTKVSPSPSPTPTSAPTATS